MQSNGQMAHGSRAAAVAGAADVVVHRRGRRGRVGGLLSHSNEHLAWCGGGGGGGGGGSNGGCGNFWVGAHSERHSCVARVGVLNVAVGQRRQREACRGGAACRGCVRKGEASLRGGGLLAREGRLLNDLGLEGVQGARVLRRGGLERGELRGARLLAQLAEDGGWVAQQLRGRRELGDRAGVQDQDAVAVDDRVQAAGASGSGRAWQRVSNGRRRREWVVGRSLSGMCANASTVQQFLARERTGARW